MTIRDFIKSVEDTDPDAMFLMWVGLDIVTMDYTYSARPPYKNIDNAEYLFIDGKQYFGLDHEVTPITDNHVRILGTIQTITMYKLVDPFKA